MRSRGPVALTALVSLLVLVACSPTIRVRAKLERVDGAPIPPGSVVVRARALCRPTPGVLPPPPPRPGPAELGNALAFSADGGVALPVAPAIDIVADITIEDGTIAFNLHGVECQTSLTAWQDASGDGVVGPGDYVGSIGPVRVVDRGACAGNLNDVGPLRLAPFTHW